VTEAQNTRARYAADLLQANVRLPLSLSRECPATIVDADGRDVATIDINRERPDPEAIKIALWLMMAVNLCGGHGSAALPAVADFLAGQTSASLTKEVDHG
jgi:hypothetical protein